jgi:hypothetical protein
MRSHVCLTITVWVTSELGRRRIISIYARDRGRFNPNYYTVLCSWLNRYFCTIRVLSEIVVTPETVPHILYSELLNLRGSSEPLWLLTVIWWCTSSLYSPSDSFCFRGLHESLSLGEHLRGMEGTTDDMYPNTSHQFINHTLHQTLSVYSLLNSTVHSNRVISQTAATKKSSKQTLLPGIISIFVCNNTHLG